MITTQLRQVKPDETDKPNNTWKVINQDKHYVGMLSYKCSK